MKLNFRVDWGYHFLYSRRHYHPEYIWDGDIELSAGRIEALYQLEYPYSWWGIPHTARETLLDEHRWQSKTRRGLAGIRVEAECEPDDVFSVHTKQGTFRFTAGDVEDEGRLVFHVGPQRMHCTVIVTRTGYLWFRPPPRPDEVVIEARQTRAADVFNFSRMEQAWIEAGKAISFNVDLAAPATDGEVHWLLHLHAMTAKDRNDVTQLARDFMPMELRANGKAITQFRQFFRFHDMAIQILHDVWAEISSQTLPEGPHELELVNLHAELPLLVHRISLRPRVRRHLDLIVPKWAIAGREFIMRVKTLSEKLQLEITWDDALLRQTGGPVGELARGDHEFKFVPNRAALGATITVRDIFSGKSQSATIEAIYDLPAETPEVKVGYDMTTVPHDDTGIMDWILDYTSRTQLGNLVCFRPFPRAPVADELVARWGNFCREHAIYAQGINILPGPLPETAREYYHASGDHEISGAVYAWDPEGETRDMKHAMERYIDHIRGYVDSTRAAGATRVAFGDASGGHQYSLMAGADFLRAETMVPHTQLLCSHARGAAQALGTGEWGVHIAIQHPKQPYLESHLKQYYLSLMQPWMMGASFIYEEDSLFVMFKEERQCWDDKLTKGKRDMTREFFHFVSTHPRWGSRENETRHGGRGGGRPTEGLDQEIIEGIGISPRSAPSVPGPHVRVAYINGRYAAPFNGFICGCEQDPSYSVWGKFGRNEKSWGHLQPEKAYQVLDVLMPGATIHPLRQRYDRREFFFSGTPYGDFDQAPIEGGAEFFSRYRLLLHLGWNTMLAEDYEALKQYVSKGGTLLIGVPQFSTHQDRAFLETMDELALYKGGDLSDLCGVRITGRGARYCGHWTATTPEFRDAGAPEASRAPSLSPDEDGPCYLSDIELVDAEPVIVDAISGKPMLVRQAVGAGTVYLMTLHAYAGHEELADFSASVVKELAAQQLDDYAVHDPHEATFWTVWSDSVPGCSKLMLLNTEWGDGRGDNKWITANTPSTSLVVHLPECEARIVTCLPFGVLVPLDIEPHVEIIEASTTEAKLHIHGTGTHSFHWHSVHGVSILIDGKETDAATGPFGEREILCKWTASTVVELKIRCDEK